MQHNPDPTAPPIWEKLSHPNSNESLLPADCKADLPHEEYGGIDWYDGNIRGISVQGKYVGWGENKTQRKAGTSTWKNEKV